MTIDNALASVAVKDLDKAAAWYAELLGSRGHRPMPEVEEWMFPRGGGLQVYQGAERAGNCSFTLAVSDIEAVARKLASMGVQPGARTGSERVRTLMVTDPDGNSIAIAEALGPALAR
jgi:predicted enzyme related to lactoylglutathione lyase